MDYDTRKKLLFSYLTSKPDGVLLRYKRPEYLSDDAARGEINDLVEDLNSKIPDCDKDKFTAIIKRFKVNLRQLVSSRHWPTIPQGLRAMKAAVEDSPAGAFDEESVLKKLVAEFQDNNRCIRFLATEALTRKMHDQNGFNLWDMRCAGFPMDKNLAADMNDQPKGEKYLAHHYSALARIWKCSVGEAQKRDQENVSRGTNSEEPIEPIDFGGKF